MALSWPAVRSSTKYLIASAVGAAATANAIRPVARHGAASLPSFASGWLTSELPLHSMVGHAVTTAIALKTGAIKGRAGLAGLGLTAVSIAGLAKIHKTALATGDVYEAALAETLGANYEAEIAGPPIDHSPVTIADIAVPNLGNRKYRVDTDIAYTGDDAVGKRNLLDIWRDTTLGTDRKAPVLFQVHGGAWTIGNKEEQAGPLMTAMVERGWVCVSINYRLSPKHAWPGHIVDVKRALAWVKENIADYGGDPDYVCITGGSAGGHLSSLAALTPNDPQFQPGFEDADTTVRAAVPFYGVYDFTNRDGSGRADMDKMLEDRIFKLAIVGNEEVYGQASTMTHVSDRAVPFFCIHGVNDSLVPVEQARAFVAMLREVSPNPVVYAELPETQHAFDLFTSPTTIETTRAVAAFLEWVRARDMADTTVGV